MIDTGKQARKRQPPESFWKTAKGRAILAGREAAYERQAWQQMDGWR